MEEESFNSEFCQSEEGDKMAKRSMTTLKRSKSIRMQKSHSILHSQMIQKSDKNKCIFGPNHWFRKKWELLISL
jgi:hypothetical protein